MSQIAKFIKDETCWLSDVIGVFFYPDLYTDLFFVY